MGRKYEFAHGKLAWNLNRCEETVLIAAYEEIARFIPPTDKWRWQFRFEDRFYEKGDGVGFNFIQDINANRKRKGLKALDFAETDVSEMYRNANKAERANRRCELREQLVDMTPEDRKRFVQQAEADMAELPPPHYTFEEWCELNERRKSEREPSPIDFGRSRAAKIQ